jgi:uncharacterized protein YqgV (UPF0045/DUF77 family)
MEKNLSIDKLLDLVTTMKFKVDATNEQIINLSMLLEYLIEKLDEQNIDIQMSSFEPWAKKKYEELEKIAKEAMEAGAQEEIKKRINEQKSMINLLED